MKTTREQFEEIWPVPEGVRWCNIRGMYIAVGYDFVHKALHYGIRLDTFTRCQETTDVYVGLIEEMIARIDNEGYGHAEWHHRAKQIIGREK